MGRITPDPIRLDNRIYVHGRNYRVSREVAQTLYDQMGKAVKHHAQIAGESPALLQREIRAFTCGKAGPRRARLGG